MATPVGWSQGGSGSVCLAFDQLRDVIESQEELIHQLRNVMVLQDENFVSKEEFQAVEKKLVEEKAAHAKTKVLLAKEEEKLQFALGEVEVLSKQLEKEKLAFEKALSSVKSRALQESSKKDQLITKCNELHKQSVWIRWMTWGRRLDSSGPVTQQAHVFHSFHSPVSLFNVCLDFLPHLLF
ncbi:spermatogenesis-associated protein 24 isoform X3 [Hippopotamus amphibius kiboko]|uniref:spermatogenesis-associated protein 24 isoform X3 n=1 Tax=Hippopotamus amphibius kiboko TaxID=575201 RepID=UPI0025986861|nr:spermatogenesis-associated protein 24 isoform X3 [Hippopotamus amphibius kiboko]